MPRLLLTAAATLMLFGCIEESPLAHQGTPRPANFQPNTGAARASEAPAQAAPSAEQPQRPRAAGAVFDGVLQVAAYTFDPPQATPGQTVTVTVFLRALKSIPVDDEMFVHVDDSAGASVRVNGDHWPAGHQVPMPQWKPGQVIRDTFQVTLSGFEQSTAATVWMGFYNPASDARMALSNPDKVKNDGNNRFALGNIPILR